MIIFVEGSGSAAVTYTWQGSSDISPLHSDGYKDLMNLVLKEYLWNKLILLVNSSYLPMHPPSNINGTNIE